MGEPPPPFCNKKKTMRKPDCPSNQHLCPDHYPTVPLVLHVERWGDQPNIPEICGRPVKEALMSPVWSCWGVKVDNLRVQVAEREEGCHLSGSNLFSRVEQPASKLFTASPVKTSSPGFLYYLLEPAYAGHPSRSYTSKVSVANSASQNHFLVQS